MLALYCTVNIEKNAQFINSWVEEFKREFLDIKSRGTVKKPRCKFMMDDFLRPLEGVNETHLHQTCKSCFIAVIPSQTSNKPDSDVGLHYTCYSEIIEKIITPRVSDGV